MITSIEVNNDLKERCREILSWKKTGILSGETLRTKASEIRSKTNDVFDMGQALSMAEQATFRELLELITASDDMVPARTQHAEVVRQWAKFADGAGEPIHAKRLHAAADYLEGVKS